MGFRETGLPCESCGSSDARAIDDQGWSHCFSCDENTKEGEDAEVEPLPKDAVPLLDRVPSVPLKARKISQDTCARFGYFTTKYKGKTVQVAPYHDDSGRVVAQKLRFKDKGMTITGKLPKRLFGQHLWKPNPNRKICITEGEIDALSVYEAMGDWPVVSIPNGAQGAAKAVSANLEYLEGFAEVVICFDMDDPGRKATLEVAKILTPGKAKIVQLPLKDANEMLQANRKTDLKNAFWNATPYQPKGLHRAQDLWEEVSKPVPDAFYHYPWPSVDEKLMGARLGEIVLWTAGSGVGKSTATREVTKKALETGIKVGVIALEESVRDTIRHQIALELNTHIHLGDGHVDPDDFRDAFNTVTPNLIVHDHWGSLATERLNALIKYMAIGYGCKMVILDHISLVVSGNDSDNERKDLDILMTNLRTIAEDYDINVQAVVHIKRLPEDRTEIKKTDLRGSAALEQLSDQIVALERNDQDEDRANFPHVRVLKNRPAGWLVGSAGYLEYKQETGRLVQGTDGDDFFDKEKCDAREGF